MRNSLTIERLREVLDYNPETGVITRRIATSNRVRANEIAGGISSKDGYRRIGIDGHIYLAHRIAWLWMTGAWPSQYIDHANLDKSDNKFNNLREATKAQNAINTSIRASNTSSFKGVCWHKQCRKWLSNITVNGRTISLGLYFTPEEAHVAYYTAAQKYFGEFARSK